MVFGLSRNRKQRLNIVKAISLARIVEGKLLMMEERLKASMNDRFKELVENHYLNDKSYSSMLAAEIAERRKLLNAISSLRLGVERLRIRLETIRDIGATAELARGLTSMLRELKGNAAVAVPEISVMLGELEESVLELTTEALPIGGMQTSPGSTGIEDPDVKAILREAAEVAAERKRTLAQQGET